MKCILKNKYFKINDKKKANGKEVIKLHNLIIKNYEHFKFILNFPNLKSCFYFLNQLKKFD